MAMNYSDYPENWEDIRAEVLERAKNADGICQCECVGECEREHKGTRCLHLQYGRLTTRSKYKVILTTAHLCHTPHCAHLDHLKSMCQPCHQVFDLRERQKREDDTTRARKYGCRAIEQRGDKTRRPSTLEEKGTAESSKRSSVDIPSGEELLLPYLKVLADGLKHSSEENRKRIKVQYKNASNEIVQKLGNGKTEFDSNIDLALACLQGARGVCTKAIERCEKMYRITKVGKAILNSYRSDLTIKDLQSWRLD